MLPRQLTMIPQPITAEKQRPCQVCAGVLPAVVTVLTPVRFLLTVSSAMSEQRAAIDGSVRTLSTPVRLLT